MKGVEKGRAEGSSLRSEGGKGVPLPKEGKGNKVLPLLADDPELWGGRTAPSAGTALLPLHQPDDVRLPEGDKELLLRRREGGKAPSGRKPPKGGRPPTLRVGGNRMEVVPPLAFRRVGNPRGEMIPPPLPGMD